MSLTSALHCVHCLRDASLEAANDDLSETFIRSVHIKLRNEHKRMRVGHLRRPKPRRDLALSAPNNNNNKVALN